MSKKALFNVLSLSLVFLLAFSTFMVATNPQSTYAKELEVVGKELGLVVEPAATGLFELSGMNPGDSEEGSFILKNSYSYPFDLYLKAEPIIMQNESGNDLELASQLELKVSYKAAEIFNGSLKDFALETINLGRFQSGDVENLVAVVHLPGPETGNEYQGKSIQVKWTFTAQSTQSGGGDSGGGTSSDPEIIVPQDPIPEGTPPEIRPDPVVPGSTDIPDTTEVEIIPEELPQGQAKMPRLVKRCLHSCTL